MSGQPPLLQALNALKVVSAQVIDKPNEDEKPLASAFQMCRTVSYDIHYAHALLREISEIALKHKKWDIAEDFAIRTLKKSPSSGAALKVLGEALSHQNRLGDAAICHRYGLPSSIRRKYFQDARLKTTTSEESDAVKCLPAHPEQFMPLKPPLSLSKKPVWELSQTQLNSAAANTFQLRDARLWFDGFNTVVWDNHSRVISDASRGFTEIVHSAMDSYTATALNGRTCVLGNRNASNYYHWMNDILPRLHVLEKSGIVIDSIDQFVVHPLEHAFQYETLKRFGITESKLCIAEHLNYVHCDELFVPLYGSNTLGKGQAPWNPAFIKSSFLDQPCAQHDQRLYISRKQASGRSINNESELILELEKRGFRTIELEGLSVAQQARLFNGASVILSPHGAGLSNIVFCEPSTTVIELFDSHIAPCFWISSEMTSLRHAIHYCGDNPSSENQAGDERYHHSADRRRLSNFSVELDGIKALLNLLEIR